MSDKNKKFTVFEYSEANFRICLHWAPYHHSEFSDIYQLEAVQGRANRFAITVIKVSCTDMLNSLDWPTLEKRRDHLKIIMMYNIINNIATYIQPDLLLTYSNAVNTVMYAPCY